MGLKVYGSPMCPDCVECKKAFEKNGIEFDYLDITGNLPFLKEFLAIRDSSSLFDESRQKKGIGIPCIVKEDGSLTLDWESLVKDYVKPSLEAGSACSLDGKGC